MGDSKLCLLLLLSTSALAFAQDEDQPTCLLAQRYKSLHKYEYYYNAESLNAINGASQLKNGPKASCKVEIEVPQTCSFIIRTTGCRLMEVVNMDAEGNPLFADTPGSDAFAAEMERYPLKVVVEGVYDVKLYPEDGETTTILNFKRGIISALAVPLLEEDKNKWMPTIHGKCRTHYVANAREDIATDISLNRDLSRCDKFVPMRDHTSPLALITGMNYPLAKLIRSSQACNYRFDNDKKHMTFGSCTENHILIPFSHKGEYGVTNVGKQMLTLVKVSPHNDRVFGHSGIVKDLHMEAAEDKSAVQDKDAVLNLLRELATLPENKGEKRAHLFHKLVSMVRGMKTENLSPVLSEALTVSRVLTYQVLAQCGTPECSSAIMRILRTFDSNSFEADATVFALGLISNPSALLINDMLEMAKYKSSKPIMYALSNVLKRFYKAEGKFIPEIYSVAEFMAAKLGDCSGNKDNTFMTLRVIGNMAPAVVPASPALRATVLQCVNQPAASLDVQQAAIQVFRLTPLADEGRKLFMEVLLDSTSPMQKRIAAYLVLMKNPQPNELTQLANALPSEQDQQVRSFIISHFTNILSSTGHETQELREKIQDAMQGNDIGPIMDPTKFSRNYKIGSLEGNMIFEGTSYLPKEVMLEMTLKAFGYDIDMMEIGMEGKGFEPTVDVLFGENGFFPDTAMKTIYFVSENMPQRFHEILKNMIPALTRDRINRQNLLKEIGSNVNKLVRELKTVSSPEAMVYLRLLGNELGYLRTSEIEGIAFSAAMMIDSMFKMFPTDLMKALMTKADNTIFAHYIFMDNEFFLPTVTGMPLRVALSGTFTPGIKGGLNIARDMSEVTFMPSAGIEFITQVGSHIPEYVNSGLEMHSNIFHESGVHAKIAISRDNIKLTIPAPTSPMKLIKMTNNLVAVIGSEVKMIPPIVMDKVNVSECNPVFAGMNYCTALQYADAFSQETAPYFPLTGDSNYVVELHPTGEVAEYTATIAYEVLREGDDGQQKVDSVQLILKADGAESTEARAVMKYNRRKHAISADIQIPDYDVEAGLRLGVVDENTKGKRTHSIYLNFINKNIPQLSLVGRANLKEMKESMLQVQLLVPSISADATVTATMKRDEELELELKSEIKVMDAISEQKISMKYDATKIEVEVKSDVNTKTTIFPNAGSFKMYGNELLDMQVGQTDMKVRHIFKKFVEATNNYMEEYGADFPYIQNFRVPDMPEISLPETLFLNIEAKAVYYINNDHYTVVIPLPLGGKSTDELNFPPALTTPGLSLHQFGLEIPSMEIPISELVVPESITLSIPLFGRAEVSTMMKSNLYEMETSVAFGLELADSSTYSAKFDIKGTSPLDILSVKLEGSGMVTTTDSIKAKFESSLTHTFIQAKIDMTEDMVITNKISLHSSSKVEAGSHFGLGVVLNHTSWTEINTEEMASEHNFEGEFKAGPIYGKTMSAQSFSIIPSRLEARIDSTVQLDSNIVKARNVIDATLVKGEVSVVSKTNAFEDVFNHKAKLTFRDTRLSLMCDANALGVKMRNQVEAFADLGKVYVRIETNADRSENRVYSLLSAAFDINGLTVNSDTNVKLLENEATHKAILIMNKDGLTTNGTTTLQSPLSMENTFTAGLDATQATLSIISKAVMHDIKVDNANNLLITLSSFDFNSKTQASVSEYASYTHDITFNLNPYTVAAKVNNNLKLLTASFINEAQLQAEDYKIDLTGSLKAIYGEEETKHIYHINYDDMSANVKCITYGKFFGTSMNHDTEIKVIGFTARIAHEVHYSSEPLSFVHSIRCNIVPFDFKFDATFNADGAMNMYGRHSANLYSKILLRAQPMSFASSHDCRASVSQQLNNGFSLDTTFENKIDTSLSLQEQKTSFAIKSKMNEHAFDQDINVYNTVERTGIEVSGKILTNIINTASTENQEFSISGFLKYDKNTDSHIIHFPLIENLPVFLEDIKGFVVHVAEALQNFINKEDIVAKLQGLPHRISDLLVQINLEENAIQLIEYFSDFTKNYVIYTDDVETFLRNVKVIVERLLANLSDCIQRFFDMMNEAIFNYNFPETIFQKVQEWLNSLNEVYDFKAEAMYVINTIREMIQSFDLESLKGSSFAFLHDIDAKYDIKAELQSIIRNIVKIIETFDLEKIVAELKRLISSIDFKAHIEELLNQIPKIIQDLDILRKINTFNASIRELTVKFEIDKTVQAILEKAVELIKKFKIDKTIEVLARMMTDISIFFLNTLEVTIDYLKTNEFKAIIQDLNILIEITEEELKSFSYNKFVHNANQMTALFTQMMNEMIQIHEIPQKLEAMYDFVSVVLSSVRGLTEHLREIKVAEFLKSLKDIFDEIVFGNLKLIAQLIKDKIASLDIKAEMTSYRDFVITYYQRVINILNDMFTSIVKMITKVVPDQKIIHEIQQIINGLFTELKKAEINMPSFTIPLTDLAVPSIRFSMDKLAEFEVPTQLDIPEFTILGFHTVKATTISIDDIQQRIIELTDLIINFNIQMFDVDAFFGDLTMNYLPSMPEISFPVITLPEISLPTIPQAPKDTLRSLQVPEIKLPTIPTEIMVPSFGKLYGEIKLHTPIYTIKMSAEFQNSTNNAMLPQFTGLFTSQGKSPSFEILNYKLDSTAGIAFPKMSRVVLGETVKFQNPAFSADHQASVTFYGRSAQAQERTEIRVTTALYTATFLNIGDIAVEEGMSAFLDTTYKHVVDIPFLAVRNDITLTQGARLHQDGYTLTLTADNTGMFNSDSPNHNSRLYLSLTPQTVNVTFTGDTDCSMLKMKQRITAETSMFSYLKFNVHNEAEAPIIKNSLFEASGLANLHDMQVKVNTNHYTEVYGAVIGDLSNSVNILAHPGEVFFEFQNKGNAKLNSFEYLSAKIDLQNDYMANFSPGSQKVNTVMLARLNKYKVMYNFTLDNNVNEAGIFTAMESEASFDFLTYPLSIPELDLPFVDFHTPAISDLNLYEQTGLKNILTTTDQTLEVDTKIVYQKSKAAPLVDMMDLIQIPSMGNLITELSIKSAITDLNVNAKLYTEDDLEFRFEATTASVFEALKAQLVGTTSLTTKRGIRLANSLFLANPHVEGFHNSSMSLSTDTFETDLSVATVAKIDLPILNLHATQELIADTKTKPNASFTLKMSGNFSIPVINTVGSAEADHKMKLKGTSEYISVASSTKANMDGTLYEDYQVFGVLDNEINLLLNNDGLHSSSKVIADAKLNHGTTKVIGMDLNETLSVEASMSRVNALLKYNGNNEAKLFNFNTNGKHIAEARVDFAPTSSLIADFDIHMSQPSSLGDFSFFEKTVAEVTPARQKIFTDTKLVSQLWNISMAAEVEGSAPIFKVIVKSSAISAFVVLEYNMNASTANFENEAFNILSKIVLTHADLNMNVEHAITQALRRMHQTDDSVSQHALNVDITSATFSDVNFRYAARRDGVSASISSPTTGFLAFQFSGVVPSQMGARIYGRYPSAPDVDVDILVIRSTPKGSDKMNLQIAYSVGAPKAMLSEIKMRLPSIISTFASFADKYQITGSVEGLKDSLINHINEIYNDAVNVEMSQLSIFFRYTIVQYQKTFQVFLDAVIKFLRETKFRLPGSDEMTSLPIVLKRLTNSIAAVVEVAIQIIYDTMEASYNVFLERISSVRLHMPVGDAVNGGQIINQAKTAFKNIFDEMVNILKNMESLDTMLEKIGETLKAVVEKTQEFVDSIKSDYLDGMLININRVYNSLVIDVKHAVDQIAALTTEDLKRMCEFIIDMLIYVVDEFNYGVFDFLQASEDLQAHAKVRNGKLEIDVPFQFQQ